MISPYADSGFSQLYALFKIANGEDITKAPAPGVFDLKVCLSPPPSPLLLGS